MQLPSCCSQGLACPEAAIAPVNENAINTRASMQASPRMSTSTQPWRTHRTSIFCVSCSPTSQTSAAGAASTLGGQSRSTARALAAHGGLLLTVVSRLFGSLAQLNSNQGMQWGGRDVHKRRGGVVLPRDLPNWWTLESCNHLYVYVMGCSPDNAVWCIHDIDV